MTIWLPQLSNTGGRIYMSIADAIADGIERGQLSSGERLPTHRALADGLGVALTTVTRAYAEAERRGLVVGEVGRGTFVRGGASRDSRFDLAGVPVTPSPIDLTANVLLPYGLADRLRDSMATIIRSSNSWDALDYQPHAGRLSQRTAGALWMERVGVAAPPDQVIVTSGAQHGMMIVLSTITKPGDTVFAEELTYSGMKSLANQLHIKIRGIPMDGDGLRPDALEAACREVRSSALYTMPTLQNPLGIVQPEKRRAEILEIATRHKVPILEDDSYGFLVPGARPIAASSPDVYYLNGTSKSLAASLRIGFLRPPADMVGRLTAAISSTTFMIAPPMADVVAEWILDGTADRIMDWKRQEVDARQELAQSILGNFAYRAHPHGHHGWLELPDPWCTDDFVAQARIRDVLVSPAEGFVVGRATPPYAVRISLGSVPTREILEHALVILADLLEAPPEPCTASV